MTPKDTQELIEFIGNKFDIVDKRFETITNEFNGRFTNLEKRIAQLPTKTWVQDLMETKFGELSIKIQRKGVKLDRLSEILFEKKILTDFELKEIKDIPNLS